MMKMIFIIIFVDCEKEPGIPLVRYTSIKG
jgi:hypothetical protein